MIRSDVTKRIIRTMRKHLPLLLQNRMTVALLEKTRGNVGKENYAFIKTLRCHMFSPNKLICHIRHMLPCILLFYFLWISFRNVNSLLKMILMITRTVNHCLVNHGLNFSRSFCFPIPFHLGIPGNFLICNITEIFHPRLHL